MRRRSPLNRAFALAAALAAALCAVRAATPFPPPAAPKLSISDVRTDLMPSVAHVQASAGGPGGLRIEQASGFVLDQNARLVLTSCHILFAEWRTLAIEVEFDALPAVKRAADALVCDQTLDLAIVHVRAFDLMFPPAITPTGDDLRLADGLYVLGFVARVPTIIPAILDANETSAPDVPGLFIRTLSDLPASRPGAANIEDAQHDLTDLRGGPLVNAQGRLVGVNAFSSEGRIAHPLSGLGFATVPKGTYYAHTIDSIAPFVRRALPVRP